GTFRRPGRGEVNRYWWGIPMIARFLCGLAGLAFVVAAAQAQTPAQQKQIQQQQIQQQKLQQKLQQGQLKLAKARLKLDTAAQQADALKKAYILLAGADHDYDGHRAKAMHSVHTAYKELDRIINKVGTAQQKTASQQEDALAAAARLAAKQTPAVHENQ